QEIYNMIRFWLEMGIDGFRLDAISHIQKAPWDFKITDNPWEPFMNVDGIDTYMKELRTIFAEYGATTVGEASGVSSRDACFWTGENGYVDMIFELEHNVRRGKIGKETIDILGMKKVLARWQNDLQEQGWNALYMENHDNPRTVSLLGDDSAKSAKAIATMYLLLKGTPFVYQGQEIGMTNFPFSSMEQIDAEDTCNLYNAKLQAGYPEEVAFEQAVNWTRDHSRTPMQWDNQSNGGFTTGKPWMLVNPNTTEVNVAVERSCKDSVLAYYKQLIYLRKKDPVFLTGAFELLLENHPQVFAYLRKTAQQQRLVLVNLGATPCQIDLPKSIYTKTWQACLSNTHSIELKERLYIGPYDAWVFKSE
ncbi:MAG: alpha-glucosidase C-terminal domain-containing protein, partial [Lactococcus lactis]|nr:alpha-glucosidase C-terminal domain-containing protein [Lactococcus lactis]